MVDVKYNLTRYEKEEIIWQDLHSKDFENSFQEMLKMTV